MSAKVNVPHKTLVRALLARHGRTYASELGIDLSKNTPSQLFRWLCACTLLSARISSHIAMDAAKALADAGWTTARKMADSTWRQRVTVLNRSGYARYDESTSRMLGETCDILLREYGGDLRELREAAGREPGKERELLKAFKGMGDVGADIFFREAQASWDELHPFADKRSLSAAGRLGLPSSTNALAKLASKKDFPRLLAGLVRVDQANGYDEVRAAAERKAA